MAYFLMKFGWSKVSDFPFAICDCDRTTHELHEGETRDGGIARGGVNTHLTLGERLFADDLGMFLPATQADVEAVKHCIHLYERASGAKLNLQKSTVLPFGLPPHTFLADRHRGAGTRKYFQISRGSIRAWSLIHSDPQLLPR